MTSQARLNTKRIEIIMTSKAQLSDLNPHSKIVERQCKYRTLLVKCAELLVDLQTEYAALHYSIYQDEEASDENGADDVFQSLYEDSNEMINELKTLRIIDASS